MAKQRGPEGKPREAADQTLPSLFCFTSYNENRSITWRKGGQEKMTVLGRGKWPVLMLASVAGLPLVFQR